MMAQSQLIVLIDTFQWRVVRMRGVRCEEVQSFPASMENQALLIDALKQFPQAPLHFLTDIVDEHYHVENMPHVTGNARKQLLARRLAAWPFAHELHTVHKLDFVKTERKEDRYLFSAIHYPLLRNWLKELQGRRVAGFYTQALCLPCWISSLTPAGPCLFIDYDKQQLRIRFLHRSKLLFSRQLTIPADVSLSVNIVNEVNQTRQYLISQHWLKDSEVLHLIGVDATLPVEQLSSGVKPVCISGEDLLNQHGWGISPKGLGIVDWATIQVVLHTQSLPNFAPAASLMRDSWERAKRSIQLASMVMICLFAVSGWCGYQAMQHTQFEIQKTKTNLAQWQSAIQKWDVVEVDLPRVKMLAQSVQLLEVSIRLPDKAWEILEKSMTGENTWQLKKVDWSYGANDYLIKSSIRSNDGWTETVAVTFLRNKTITTLEAKQAWHSLLGRLQAQPEISKLIEVKLPATSESPGSHGDTRRAVESADQQTIEIQLRNLKG